MAIKTSKGKTLPEYPKLVKHPETGKKHLFKTKEEEEKGTKDWPKAEKPKKPAGGGF